MTAKGKINASKVQAGDRILVQVRAKVYAGDTAFPSSTKTGEAVVATTVRNKVKHSRERGYVIVTGAGQFYAEPIQTMWLAPEDAPGVKRAHVEALAEDALYVPAATPAGEEMDQPSATAQLAEDECHICGGPLASDGVCADDLCDEDQAAAEAEQLELQIEAANTPAKWNAAGAALGDAWSEGKITDEAFDRLEVARRAKRIFDETLAAHQAERWLQRHAVTPRIYWSRVEDGRQADHAAALIFNAMRDAGTLLDT
jgi:hypothetical protein